MSNSSLLLADAGTIADLSCVPDSAGAGVVAQLHFDGDYSDKSLTAATPVNYGTSLTTVNAKFKQSMRITRGTTQGVLLPSNTAYDLNGGDFTIQGWIRVEDYASSTIGYFCRSFDGPDEYTIFAGGNSGVGPQNFSGYYPISAGAGYNIGLTAIVLNVWTHLAFCRKGNTYFFFVNGVLRERGFNTYRRGASAKTVSIGNNVAGSNNFTLTGLYDEFQINKTTAKYTGDIVVPVVPYATTAERTILLHFDGPNGTSSGIIDSSSNANVITRFGGMVTSTAQSVFNGSSLLADGVNDYLLLTAAGYMQPLATFTVECRFYAANITPQFLWSFNANGGGTETADRVLCTYAAVSGGYLGFQVGTTSFNTLGSSLSTNAWHHVALVVMGTRALVWIDSVLIIDQAIVAPVRAYNRYTLCGSDCPGVTNSLLQGYMDEFQYSNGFANFSPDFTPGVYRNCDSAVGSLPAPPASGGAPQAFTALAPKTYLLSSSTNTLVYAEYATFCLNGLVILGGSFGGGERQESWATPAVANGALAYEYRVLEGAFTTGASPSSWTPMTTELFARASLLSSPYFSSGGLVRFQIRQISTPANLAEYLITYRSFGNSA